MDEATLQTLITVLVVLAYFLGVGFAVVWPYINTRLQNPGLKFDWRYAIWQFAGGVAIFATGLLASGRIPEFGEFLSQGWYGILLAAIAGYGSGRLGREAQRTNEARLARKE